MKNDEFGDRMKSYEALYSMVLTNTLPVYARIDGRCFSTFTRKFQKPFDTKLSSLMDLVTSNLVELTGAKCGYVQSDEISLVWEFPIKEDGSRSEIMFGGKVNKLNSVLASQTTSLFIRNARYYNDDFFNHVFHSLVTFDCRVMNMPSRTEAANMVLWRAMDAKKNGIQSIAHSLHSHKILQGKTQKDMLEMIPEEVLQSVSMRDRFGLFVRKKDDGFRLDACPAFNEVKNREEFIFDGAMAQYAE